ncbi:protein of unknown function DUF1242 [Kipferlia bialata]|uniref:Protein kish n=1 Tax=Kipferlia bialata TaxID=797122 RepID=A0A9K3DDG4_9EUKA|nr:protein of unknown function DUF1242 [Kipferlia bialata]|eukprot:g15381.t1
MAFSLLLSGDGFLIVSLLLICICTHLRRIPKLCNLIINHKHGLRGTLYKASVIGTRLSLVVSVLCVLMGLYMLFV